jgi:hypothetical protein
VLKEKKEMENNQLSRSECNALRGLAIIGIFMHNFCHWLNPIVKENEYQYLQKNVDWFTHVVTDPNIYLPVQLLSFFGHYGVPIFLFLSAYGLVMKYEKGAGLQERAAEQDYSWSSIKKRIHSVLGFIRYHYLKLFKMMIVGFVGFVMVDQFCQGEHHYQVLDIVSQLLMFNNILPNPDDIIWPGPFWFFGLMLQLYIVYRLFLYRGDGKRTIGLTLICVALQFFFDPEGETINRYRYNFMGGMLPFGMGILYARYFHHQLSKVNETAVFLLSTVLVIVLSYNQYSWAFVPVSVCIASISMVKILPAWFNIRLEWFGSISAALFVCHPITRKIFITISREGDIYVGLLLYVMTSVCLAWLFRDLLKHIPSPKFK